MSIVFYYGSGSPFGWKVWLALEHKQLPYELKQLSMSGGDLRQPEYLAINPRGKVPALVDDGVTLWESAAILEYIEDRYPEHPLLPRDLGDRAKVRRIAVEAVSYLYPPQRRLFEYTLFRPDGNADSVLIAETLADLRRELAYFSKVLQGDFFAGSLSIADFTIYPLLALLKRLHQKQPQHGVDSLIDVRLGAFMQRIEQLPYFAKTLPPHWKG